MVVVVVVVNVDCCYFLLDFVDVGLISFSTACCSSVAAGWLTMAGNNCGTGWW